MINVILLLNIIYSVYSIKCPNQNCTINNVEGVYIHILREENKINEIDNLINCYNRTLNYEPTQNIQLQEHIQLQNTDTKEKRACSSLLRCFRDLQDGCKSEQYYDENKQCDYKYLQINKLYIRNDCEIIFYNLIITQNKIKKNLNKFKNQYNITNITEIKLLLIELKMNIIYN